MSRGLPALGDTGSSLGRYGSLRVPALGDTEACGFQPWAIREPAGSSLGRYGSLRVPALGDTRACGCKPWAIRKPAGSSFGRYASRRGSASRIQGAGGGQLPAFGGPVGVSFPHSRGRWGQAPRIRGAGWRRLRRRCREDGQGCDVRGAARRACRPEVVSHFRRKVRRKRSCGSSVHNNRPLRQQRRERPGVRKGRSLPSPAPVCTHWVGSHLA